jgi:O-antigen ligase
MPSSRTLDQVRQLELEAQRATPRMAKAQSTAREAKTRQQVSTQGGEIVDSAIFWVFVAGLAWVPYLYGSNVLEAWGINAVLFPGVAVAYELSLLVRGVSHPVAIKEFWVSAVLLAAVVLWILVQNATWTPSAWHHAIWQMSANELQRPVLGSISVNRDLTTLALIRLITATSVFWITVQLCRNGARANYLIGAIAAIGTGYAGYGLINFIFFSSGPLNWFGNTAATGFVTSTFFNQNHYATYAGIGLVAMCGLILRHYRKEVTSAGESIRFWASSVIEASGQMGALLFAGAATIFIALLLSASRGGILATGLGLAVLGLLWFGHRNDQSPGPGKKRFSTVIIVGLAILTLGSAILLAFGDTIFGKISAHGLHDDARMAVYTITLRSILASPWLGYGYGTFQDVFPMFRDRSLPPYGIWEQAHCTYLEIFQGLGIIFGSMLLASVGLLIWKCLAGALAYRKGTMVCCVAIGAAFLVGVHALVDFSLQMQAVAVTFIAILGAGVAQSKSSRFTTQD